MMFTLTEVASLNDIQPTYRILKPWWDVFMDYLGLVMLMLAIFAMTMQITKDQVACLPCLEDQCDTPGAKPSSFPHQPAQATASTASTGAPVASTLPYITKDLPDEAVHEIHTTQQHTAELSQNYPNQPQPTGIRTNLDYQQYIFVNQICYHVALPWYSKYFPYLTLIHTIVLMVSSNFWFKYPKTSSKIEHFVSILGRCFESPWTTKALSETACEDSEENKQRLTGTSSVPKKVKSLESLHLSQNKLESLPPAWFTLPKLRHLDVSHNWTGCPLCSETAACCAKSGLVVDDHLFDTLPVEVKESISRETNVSFTSGL